MRLKVKRKFLSIFLLIPVILSAVFNVTPVQAKENALYLEGDYIEINPTTNKYSSDWSHLDTKENFDLQNDVRNFHEKVIIQNLESNEDISILSKDGKVNNSLTDSEITELETLNKRVEIFFNSFNSDMSYVKSNKTEDFSAASTNDYFESYYSKLIEIQLHLAKDVLSPSEIAGVNENAGGARDHAVRYATNNKWYTSSGVLKTWDNPADTLRHFAWNYMNSKDFGTGKARLAGDLHELALVGVTYINQAWGCVNSVECKVTYAAVKANRDGYASQTSLSKFNSTFDNASIMDLINNSKGRKAFVNGYDSYSEPFNIGLKNGSLVQFPTWVNTAHRNTAWNSFK